MEEDDPLVEAFNHMSSKIYYLAENLDHVFGPCRETFSLTGGIQRIADAIDNSDKFTEIAEGIRCVADSLDKIGEGVDTAARGLNSCGDGLKMLALVTLLSSTSFEDGTTTKSEIYRILKRDLFPKW